jgi:hypothetical protein
MVGDTNPLFLDPEFAAGGPYGAVIVPPTVLHTYFAGNGPWPRRVPSSDRRSGPASGVPTPGDRGINMNTSWDYLLPVRVGDRLGAEHMIADVFIKAIRLDPKAVWVVTETRITNQHDEVVAVGTNTVLVHRSPAQISGQDVREVAH